MLYASDFRYSEQIRNVKIEDNPEDIPDLIAEFLIQSVKRRLKQLLTQDYQQTTAKMSRVKGRINILETESKHLLKRGQVACVFQALTLNTPRNCYVRSALQLLSGTLKKHELKVQCKHLASQMISCGIIGEKPTERQISMERFGRHDLHDKPMLSAARLAFQLALPTEEAGEQSFLTPDREEHWIRNLFEKAVAGFYQFNLHPETWCKLNLFPATWRVETSKRLLWQIESASAGIDKVLPNMRTDIILNDLLHQRRIIIDTKFTSILKKGWFRDSTLSSSYLYQIYAYLFSQKREDDEASEGVLLHPSVGEAFDEFVVIQGHCIRFMTVDLAGDPAKWKDGLLRVVRHKST